MLIDDNSDTKIVECIAKAISHASAVARREHVKAVDRHERVALFCTSLRHEITSNSSLWHRDFRKVLVEALCRKAVWYDIGIADDSGVSQHYYSNRGYNSMSISQAQISGWSNKALSQVPAKDFHQKLLEDIDGLNKSLVVFDGLNQQAKRLNAEADVVMDKLAALVDSV